MSGEVVHEDDQQHGEAGILSSAFEVEATTKISVHLPRTYQDDSDVRTVPFVLWIGSYAIHMQRAEVQRVHDLLGRALAAHDETSPS